MQFELLYMAYSYTYMTKNYKRLFANLVRHIQKPEHKIETNNVIAYVLIGTSTHLIKFPEFVSKLCPSIR